MKIELNLDTREKQALFLALFNNPNSVVDYLEDSLKKDVDIFGLPAQHPCFSRELMHLDEESMLDLLNEVFTFKDWAKVYDEYNPE